MRQALLAGLSVAVLAGCSPTSADNQHLSPSPSGPAEQTAAAPGSAGPVKPTAPTGKLVASYFEVLPHPGLTWSKNGRPVSARELQTAAGERHCHWQYVVMMWMGWPPGTVAQKAGDERQFIRDPAGFLGVTHRDGFAKHISMPDDAQATGYHHGDLGLWLSPSDPFAVYLRVENDVERWPLAMPTEVCK